ncbi:Thiol:disulfide interchange protein DsbD precursor [Rubripirellula obstinata]|uniref:Thiol:disulfide interchange protein DsbD n=1 Tax=Rubripirellula obstinata TaxID=406547 RepID=A0A5B1CC08_9BACT|nr:thioredoxin family protein [Rubripirellula obstinata]KAA1257771.1 Thiol:disulfide interchange protein DsbD precursor [Rubripirellula obstinata]
MLNRGLLLYKSPALAVAVLSVMAFLLGTVPEASAQAGGGFGSGGLKGRGLQGFGMGRGGPDDRNPSQWEARYFTTEDPGIGVLEVEVVVANQWYVYSVTQPPGGPLKTKITLVSPDSVSIASDFKPDEKPELGTEPVYQGVTIEKHKYGVVWTAAIRLPEDFEDDLKLDILALICKPDGGCVPFEEVIPAKFAGMYSGDNAPAAVIDPSVPMEPTDKTADTAGPPTGEEEFSDAWADAISEDVPVSDDEAASENTPNMGAETDTENQVQPTEGATSFPLLLLFALLGGFVLNFMPCVLPVIGLKMMSFVGQGGENRKRIFALNLAYVAGICVVFAILAFFAIVFSFSWGQQFQYFSVRLGVTVGLFAFALSYFNVWEIPVPGMAAGKTSQDLQSKEGFTGAFSKGIFTTLLATPCSGPLLGGVFGATLGMTSPQIALVFAMLALGMSSPYLAIGMKPGLVKFLPKPGPWMETFKQLMAFLFIAAVCYFFYQFSDENKFPVFVTLMGVWFGCWIIGQVPGWAAIQKRLLAWTAGVGIATAIGVMAFTTLKAPPVLNWVDYDEQKLAAYQAEGKTVMVDFSAKWCVNCLVNLATAIDTEKTRRVVDRNNVVTMYADWTDRDPAMKVKFQELGSNSIPLLAIYPAGKPDQPIVLRDLVSQSMVIEALEEAGPSKNANEVAMRR